MVITTSAATSTMINDLPDAILLNIFALVSDTRTRNSLSLVCRKFGSMERITRTSLTLRGNVRDLFMIPRSFRSVTHLDLSLLSPWGHPFLTSGPLVLLAQQLGIAFPLVNSLTVYARSPSTLQILLAQWPRLSKLKLVRWHQRPSPMLFGPDFDPLFEQCPTLSCLDLSDFYYWTEDLPPVMQKYPGVSASLFHLNLLTVSLTEGFKSNEIRAITAVCPNLGEFLVACTFDPRYIGYVGDETLLAISTSCPKLKLLHLADTSSLANLRADPEDEGYTAEDARISTPGLTEFVEGLPLLEVLVLDVCKNVRDSALVLEVLNSKCPKLKALKLGQFHGICMAIESQLDGIALCAGLESLSIKNCADLTDMGLIEIGRGCCRLAKFEVQGCKQITEKGLRTMTCLLRRTLVDVKISCCKNLDASASIHALDPIHDRIEQLHIDCVWNGLEDSGNSEGAVHGFDLIELEPSELQDIAFDFYDSGDSDDSRMTKKCRYWSDIDYPFTYTNENGFLRKSWDRLRCLSLWIGVGELISPLPMVGLEYCPNLEEIRIKVEGDCRGRQTPSDGVFGLGTLERFPRLSKMQLDCGETIGFALTAPSGQMDLSLWERFFLTGIESLNLNELDYWPPQDRDVNHRSLSLPAAGLLAECLSLRKLFIHGTAHEHFMMFLLKIPNLRDVQLREDYYPAPEIDSNSEMRVVSCSRFEDKLNIRTILD